MAQYIKSHSNYILSKKHQDISDGTIWERDITTIGGVNQFSPGQIPIFKDSNFIITVRNDGKIANQYNHSKWNENESGETWTLQTVSGMTSEFEDQNDLKIVLKQDYYDFRDFAYYGSLTEYFRASINDALQRFPGELYSTSDEAYYTSSITIDFNVRQEQIRLGDEGDGVVYNPYGIDIHSVKKPKGGKEIKYFADGGYENYQIIDGDGDSGSTIEKWDSENYIKVVRRESILDEIYGDDAFYYDFLKDKLDRIYPEPNRKVWWIENKNNIVAEKSINHNGEERDGYSGYTELVEDFQSGEIHSAFTKYNNEYWIERDGKKLEEGIDNGFFETYESAYTYMMETYSGDSAYTYTVGHGAKCGDVECYVATPCKGYMMASVTANTDAIVIDAWVSDNNEIVYLSKDNDVHIRPIEKYIVEFYNECNNFEKILLNRKTTPKYKSTFSVIKENEKGYYREMEDFIFPTSQGGYNLDTTSFNYNSFTKRLAEIGAFYDEYFTDNMWRSMTHEAIKNFDWSHTREYVEGDEEEFVHGGEKIQKALRVFAREFDEILTYIDNIKNVGRVTYDERNNIPDYFLIDELEKKGWDTCLVQPYDLVEFEKDNDGNYIKNENGEKIVIDDKYDDELFQLSGDGEVNIVRNFSQNSKKEINPYQNKWLGEYKYGYFIVCEEGDLKLPCGYDEETYGFKNASGSGSTYYDESSKRIVNRIKSYSDERAYTYMDANNEFIRRMTINSPYIWRHKGTVEGIEMLLGMFGLKSKRWVDAMPTYRGQRMYDGISGLTDCKQFDADYEISEYTSFANRIEEKWDTIHQMYRINWINSTKAIVYDYRSTSNYTSYGAQTNYVNYQGIPVSYRDEYLEYKVSDNGEYVLDENGNKIVVNDAYIKVDKLDPCEPQSATSSVTDAFKEADTNKPIRRRYLYPNFNKYEQLDGNPYFQMNGGWLSKTIQHGDDEEHKYNFQFDVDDNISYTKYINSGYTDETEGVIDNKPLFTETIRNIKRVDNITELLSTPSDNLLEGTIYYVSNIEKNAALINDEIYEIKYEYNGGGNASSRYVVFTKNNEYIKVGSDRFFDKDIIVYDKFGVEITYDLIGKPSGYEVKAYIIDDEDKKQFICQADKDGYYTIDSFSILEDALPKSGMTNYFVIDEPYYSNRIANVNTSAETYGWRALKESDAEYIRINAIKNYYEGNNPHNGNMNYDNGHEYFTYFNRLFKYAIDEDMFDERCYESFFIDLDNEIQDIGFKGLIDDNEMIRQYNPFVSVDSKVHYFGTYYKRAESGITDCTNVKFYGESKNKMLELGKKYKEFNSAITVDNYILNDEENVLGDTNPYSGHSGTTYTCNDKAFDVPTDEVTDQIVNNKRMTIRFNLHNKWYSQQGQCEVKYLDSIVMNYLTQMIPSTAIVDIQYVSVDKENEQP